MANASEQSDGDRLSRPSSAGKWVMGCVVPLVLVGLGVLAFVQRHAFVPGRSYSSTLPLEAVDGQATGWGLALFGAALLLNSLFFDIGGRLASNGSAVMFVIALLLIFGGLFSMVFSH